MLSEVLDGLRCRVRYRILYVGDLRLGGTCRQRMTALRDLGHDVDGVSTHSVPGRYGLGAQASRITGLAFRLGIRGCGPLDLAGANERIHSRLRSRRYDLLWVDKGVTVRPRTLEWVRRRRQDCTIVGYSPDDMGNRQNQSTSLLIHLPYYHLYVTTKSYNVPELRKMGCAEVLHVGNAFDPHTHRPLTVSDSFRAVFGGTVGFIGNYESARAQSIRSLARSGVPVRICGDGWPESFQSGASGVSFSPGVFGDDYARTICALDVNLGFLRKINRDLQTTRSVEVPACGAFLLAERTPEHLAMFEEGREAEFFSDDAELRDKASYYARHQAARARIAEAGLRRCWAAGYSNWHRLSVVLEYVNNLRI